MSMNPNEPYNDLPFLLPDEKQWKTLEVLEQCIRANRALAELKGRVASIPNPGIFINALSIQEAKASSAIENVMTSDDRLYRAVTSKYEPDPATKEVLRYGKAMRTAYESLRKCDDRLDINLILNVYRAIKDEKDGIRDYQVYIGNSEKVIFTPPCCKSIIENMLDNWVDVANAQDEIDPLIKMAMLHYQFEAIHPFKDGNGRAGRVLNVLYLCACNLLEEPVLYLSGYINENKQDYYSGLKDVTENGQWSNWIAYMLRAVEATAVQTLDSVLNILRLLSESREWMLKEVPEIYSHELLEVLFMQVYSKYAMLEANGIASRNTASKYLNLLTDKGFLEKEKVGNELIFKNVRLYELLRQ